VVKQGDISKPDNASISCVWLTTGEAAAYLGVTAAVVRKLISQGELTAYQPGRRDLRLKRSDVESYLESVRVKPEESE
jgi:DNA binding domain, excisionase family